MLRRRFHAMGTEIELILDAPASTTAFAAIAGRGGGRAAPRAPALALRPRLGALAAEPAPDDGRRPGAAGAGRARARRPRATSGRFDPTVHDALVAAGYDRTFDELPAHRANRGRPRRPLRRRRSPSTPRRSTIELDPGVRLDLGGIAKGYAADRAARSSPRSARASSTRAATSPLHGKAWPVGVETGEARSRSSSAAAGSRPPAATGAAGRAAAASSTT